MDITLKQVDEAVSDPAKKVEIIEKLMANIEVIEDENGAKFEIIQLKDVTVKPAAVNPNPEMAKKGLRMHSCSDLRLRDDDVILVNYAKTGTHWFCNILHYLMKTGPLEDELSVQPLLLEMFPPQMIDNLPNPRILKTQHTPANIPTDAYKGRGKLVLLFRNPKDAAVSQFYHLKRIPLIGEMNLSWNCFVQSWMRGLIPPGGFFDFYNTWQKDHSENKTTDVLVVHYEDMKNSEISELRRISKILGMNHSAERLQQDGISELRRMSKFLGLTHSDERLQQIIGRCSINNLRADVDSGKVKSPLVNKEGKSMIYRKGVIGDWKNHFTVAQNETMDALIAEKLKDSIFKCQY